MSGNPFARRGCDPDQLSSDRLSLFIAAGAPSGFAGPISIDAESLGSSDDWAWSAVSYLKGALEGTRGGALGGSVSVSAAAVGVLLAYVEQLAIETGRIDAPGGAS